MANIQSIIPFIKKWAGGFQNDPNDKANYTKDGTLVGTYCDISASFYESFFDETPTEEDLKNISDEKFGKVLENFATSVHFDEINNDSVALIIFDWVWASGLYYPTKHIQSILGITSDGAFGKMTVSVINSFEDQQDLFNKLKQARLDYVDALIEEKPSLVEFEKGWKNRINDINYIETI